MKPLLILTQCFLTNYNSLTISLIKLEHNNPSNLIILSLKIIIVIRISKCNSLYIKCTNFKKHKTKWIFKMDRFNSLCKTFKDTISKNLISKISKFSKIYYRNINNSSNNSSKIGDQTELKILIEWFLIMRTLKT